MTPSGVSVSSVAHQSLGSPERYKINQQEDSHPELSLITASVFSQLSATPIRSVLVWFLGTGSGSSVWSGRMALK